MRSTHASGNCVSTVRQSPCRIRFTNRASCVSWASGIPPIVYLAWAASFAPLPQHPCKTCLHPPTIAPNMAWATWLTRALRNSDLMIALAILVVVTMLILPMPKWMLDTFIVFNFAASIVIALMAVNITNPLQFSVFPALLLVTTLFRLALSIVATKLILGTGSAGKVIETFGQFVVGGDFVVGVVAFLILVVVQFVVITNGAGRWRRSPHASRWTRCRASRWRLTRT